MREYVQERGIQMVEKIKEVQEVKEVYRPKHHVRFVTASSLFDGHDVSVNIIRRILQLKPCRALSSTLLGSRHVCVRGTGKISTASIPFRAWPSQVMRSPPSQISVVPSPPPELAQRRAHHEI